MIYGYLYEKTVTTVDESFFNSEAIPESFRVSSHLWKSEALGNDVHREFWEHFYRCNTFAFSDKFNLLPRFRVSDPWNIGCVPATLPTNIQVVIRMDAYDIHMMRRDGPNYETLMNRCKGYHRRSNGSARMCSKHSLYLKSRRELLAELDILFGFAADTRLVLYIIPLDHDSEDPTSEQEEAFNLIFPVILPFLVRVRASGLKVHVLVEETHFDHVSEDFILGGDFSLELAKEAFEKVSKQMDYKSSRLF